MIVEGIKWTCSCGRRNLLKNRDVGRAYYRPTDIAREYGQGEILPQDLTTHLVCRCGMLWKKQRVRSYTVRWGKKEYTRHIRYRAAWMGLIRWALTVASARRERVNRYLAGDGIKFPAEYANLPDVWKEHLDVKFGVGYARALVAVSARVQYETERVWGIGSVWPVATLSHGVNISARFVDAEGSRVDVHMPSTLPHTADESIAAMILERSRRRRG